MSCQTVDTVCTEDEFANARPLGEPEAIEADDNEIDVAALHPREMRRAREAEGPQSTGEGDECQSNLHMQCILDFICKLADPERAKRQNLFTFSGCL